MSVLQLDDVKRYLRFHAVTDLNRDVELQATIDSAEATIARKIGPLLATAVTERVAGGGALLLSTLPVWSVTSVTPTGGGTALVVGDLLLSEDDGMVTFANGVTTFTATEYAVTYQAGHAATAAQLPADIVNGIKELVRHRWAPQRGGGAPRAGGDDGAAASTDVRSMPQSVADLIADYTHDELGFA